MLSIGALASGHETYYLNMASEDYYLSGGEPPGHWWGRGAELLGLSGQVGPPDFRALLAGYHPNGQALIQNAGTSNHQPGWDLTFSAPKSVSALWFLCDDASRRHVQKAHLAAVQTALSFLEDDVAVSRMGKGGQTHVSARLVVALFEHGSSRAGDPHLHTHCIIINVGIRPDDSTGTLRSRGFYAKKMVAGALYRATLAAELQRRLGVRIERRGFGFDIEGIPFELVQHLSKRRNAIEQRLAKKGLRSAKAAAIAALDTREAKARPASRHELFTRWRQEAASLGFTSIPNFTARPFEQAAARSNLNKLIDAAVYRAASSGEFSKSYLLRHVATESIGKGFDGTQIRSAVDTRLSAMDRFFLSISRSLGIFLFKRAFRLDKQSFKLVRRLRARGVHGVDAATVEQVLRRHSRPRNAKADAARHHVLQLAKAARDRRTQKWSPRVASRLSRRVLSAYEKQAIRAAVERKRGGIRLIDGGSGINRNHVVRATREALEKAGYRVVIATPSKMRARELDAYTGAESITLRSLERRLRPTLKFQATHAAKQLTRAVRNRRTFWPKPFGIDKRTAVIITGAERVNTSLFKLILRRALLGGGLTIFVGTPIVPENGRIYGVFSKLLERYATLSPHSLSNAPSPSIRRIRLSSEDERIAYLMRDWFRTEARHTGKAVLLGDTGAETERLNALCQAERVLTGELRGRCLTIGGRRFFEGDRVVFRADSRALGVVAGETGVVTRVCPRSEEVLVRLDDGARLRIPVRSSPELVHGYAVENGTPWRRLLSHVFALGEPNRSSLVRTLREGMPEHITVYQCERDRRVESATEHTHEFRQASQRPEHSRSL